MKKLTPQLADARDWRHVRDGIKAKVCLGPEGSETFLLVRSADRQQEEQAMHQRFCAYIETGLASLARRLEAAKSPIDNIATERQIGRLLGRNSRRHALCDTAPGGARIAEPPASCLEHPAGVERAVAAL